LVLTKKLKSRGTIRDKKTQRQMGKEAWVRNEKKGKGGEGWGDIRSGRKRRKEKKKKRVGTKPKSRKEYT